MLTIFIGDDSARAKAEVRTLVEGAVVVRFGEGGEPFERIGAYLEQQGMFTPKVALVLDRPFDDTVGKEWILERGDELAAAAASVVAIIPEVSATEEKKLTKNAVLKTYTAPRAVDTAPPSVFGLTDAYQRGDRKGAWVAYRTLIERGVRAEEIHGALAWAVRGMVLAGKTSSAAEAGMKDYPYRKAKSAAARIGTARAENLSAELVDLYHRAHAGQGDLEDLLEIFLLRK